MYQFGNPRIISILEDVIIYYQVTMSRTNREVHDYWVHVMKIIDGEPISTSYTWEKIFDTFKDISKIVGKDNLLSIVKEIYNQQENPESYSGKYEREIGKIYIRYAEDMTKYIKDNDKNKELDVICSVGMFKGSPRKFITGHLINLGAIFYAETNYPQTDSIKHDYKTSNYNELIRIITET